MIGGKFIALRRLGFYRFDEILRYAGVSAGIHKAVDAARDEIALACEAGLDRSFKRGTHRRGNQRLRAREVELHRPPHAHRRVGSVRLVEKFLLASERAAHRHLYDAHLAVRDFQQIRDDGAHAVDALSRAPYRQLAVRPVREIGVRLHRGVVHLLRFKRRAEAAGGLAALLSCSAAVLSLAYHVAALVDGEAFIRRRGFDRRGDGQVAVGDFQPARPFARRLAALSDDGRYHVACVTRAAREKLLVLRHVLLERRLAAVVVFFIRGVPMCEHLHDAAAFERRARVYRRYLRVRALAAHQLHIKHSRQRHVRGVDQRARRLVFGVVHRIRFASVIERILQNHTPLPEPERRGVIFAPWPELRAPPQNRRAPANFGKFL